MVFAINFRKKMHRVSSNFVIPAVVILFIRSQTSRCDTISDCLEYTYDKCDFNKDDQQHLIEVLNNSPSIDQCQFFCRSVSANLYSLASLLQNPYENYVLKYSCLPDPSTMTSVKGSFMRKGKPHANSIRRQVHFLSKTE